MSPRALSLLVLPLSLLAAGTQAAHEIAISDEQAARLGITLVPIEAVSAYVTDRLPARVVIPPQQARVVAAPRGGLVTALEAALGDSVSERQVLARIESPDLVVLQRELLQAATQLRLARSELERDAQLHKEGIIAERRLLETRSRHEEAAALVDERRQVLLLAGMSEPEVAELEASRKLSTTLPVRSPIAGVVVEAQAVLGERVGESQPLYRIARMEPLWLEIDTPIDRLAGVSEGSPVELPCPGGSAQVSLIGRNVDPTNQTVMVRSEVKDSGDCLRPGQFVEVRLRLASAKPQFRVPSGSITRIGDADMVFVQEPAGFAPVSVLVLGREDGYSVVTGGLAPDARVAASGIAALKAAWTGRDGGE